VQAAIHQLGGAFADGDAPGHSDARDAPKKLDIVAVRSIGCHWTSPRQEQKT